MLSDKCTNETLITALELLNRTKCVFSTTLFNQSKFYIDPKVDLHTKQ